LAVRNEVLQIGCAVPIGGDDHGMHFLAA